MPVTFSPPTLLSWLEELCDQLEGVEQISKEDPYEQGMFDGSRLTQEFIAKKIRFAIQSEQLRLLDETEDLACCEFQE